jgi:hypothetical protein
MTTSNAELAVSEPRYFGLAPVFQTVPLVPAVKVTVNKA